jgi:anti-repressor protein
MNNLVLVENNMIPIYTKEEGEHLVNARELHTQLGSKANFRDWIKDRIAQAELEENVDYVTVLNNAEFSAKPRIGRPAKEYGLTLDAAKHISMLEGNAKGKQIRQYFIEFEKKARKALPEKTVTNLTSTDFAGLLEANSVFVD